MKKMLILLLFVIVSCSGSDSTSEEVLKKDFNKRSDFRMIGHRGGLAGANADNSLAALQGAMARNYDMAEIDIRFTKDGIPILHHEADLSDVYSSATQPISSLTIEEIQKIKNDNGGLLPYTLEEFATTSNGEIGFLLDFKEGSYQSGYYAKCIEIFKNHNISNVKVAWSSPAKNYFFSKETVKIELSYLEFADAYPKSTFSSNKYFLLASAYEFNPTLIKKALELNVEVVVSVNKWSYGQIGITSTTIIEKDINKMISAGVRSFLIDTVFDPLFNFED